MGLAGLGAGAASMLDARDYGEVLSSGVLSPWMRNALVDERLQTTVRKTPDALSNAAGDVVAEVGADTAPHVELLSEAISSRSTRDVASGTLAGASASASNDGPAGVSGDVAAGATAGTAADVAAGTAAAAGDPMDVPVSVAVGAAAGAAASSDPRSQLWGRVRISTSTQTPSLVEYLTPCEAACEDAMLGMRLATGIPRARFELLLQQAPRLLQAANQVVNDGLATWQNNRLMPTDRGWLLGNQLYGAMWDCASE